MKQVQCVYNGHGRKFAPPRWRLPILRDAGRARRPTEPPNWESRLPGGGRSRRAQNRNCDFAYHILTNLWYNHFDLAKGIPRCGAAGSVQAGEKLKGKDDGTE